MKTKRSLEFSQKRFMSHVTKGQPDECWIWNGAKGGNKIKYGQAGYQGKIYTAHRLAYILFVGPVSNDVEVCHTCDNPLCVNPAHLWLGTHTDNMRDKMRKGRGNHQIGEINHAAKLTEQDVLEIREWLKQGMPQREIGRRKGVTSTTISYINTRTTWRHI